MNMWQHYWGRGENYPTGSGVCLMNGCCIKSGCSGIQTPESSEGGREKREWSGWQASLTTLPDFRCKQL